MTARRPDWLPSHRTVLPRLCLKTCLKNRFRGSFSSSSSNLPLFSRRRRTWRTKTKSPWSVLSTLSTAAARARARRCHILVTGHPVWRLTELIFSKNASARWAVLSRAHQAHCAREAASGFGPEEPPREIGMVLAYFKQRSCCEGIDSSPWHNDEPSVAEGDVCTLSAASGE